MIANRMLVSLAGSTVWSAQLRLVRMSGREPVQASDQVSQADVPLDEHLTRTA
jgi:hypothetical protein